MSTGHKMPGARRRARRHFRLPRPGHKDQYWEWKPTQTDPRIKIRKRNVRNKMQKVSRRRNR